MHLATRAICLVLLLGLAALPAGCGSNGPSPAAPGTAGATGPVATAATTPDLTPVPTPPATAGATVAATEAPAPTPGGGTTETEWGTILDVVPDGFPVFPGASPADATDGPASGAWITDAGVDETAGWYADTLAAAGYGVDLGSALEDGSRVLDAVTDLPECRIQVAFRPAGESTMITVLYGAGCAGPAG